MLRKHVLSLLVVVLIFLVPSCGNSETILDLLTLRKAFSNKRKSHAQANRPTAARSDGLITLKPPYTGLKYDENDPNPRISLQNAVDVIARQAGMKYNRSKSYKNAQYACTRWVYPDFEDKPWKEAVEELLAPFHVAYVVEGDKIILMNPEDALQWTQQMQNVREGLSSLLENKDVHRLPDAIIIFPLLDSRGQTTQTGTMLSELAMLKLTYVPEKVVNLHFPAVIDLYHDHGYDRRGKTLSSEMQKKILRRFDTQDAADGTFELSGDGHYKITLSFSGRNGKKVFSASGQEGQLYTVPQWIAECAHEYCNISLSPQQQQYVDSPEVNSTASLYDLQGLERDFRNGKTDLAPWRQYLRSNPESVFGLYRIDSIPKHEEQNDHAQFPIQSPAVGQHDLLKFLEANWYQEEEQQEESVPRFLELYRTDYRNEVLLAELDEGLLSLGMGEKAAALCDMWEKREPNSSLPLYAKGDFYIDYGWDARGTGYASTVTEEGWRKLEERMGVAEQCLTKALKLNPDDPRIPARLISVALGQRYGRDQMENWFQMAVAADPAYYPAYKLKLNYLTPNWYGEQNGSDMFGFVRECMQKAPEELNVADLFQRAHVRMAYSWARETGRGWKEYFAQPDVWREVKGFYEQWLSKHPDSVIERNYYAKFAFYANAYGDAVRQFQMIGKDIDTECWSEKTFYQSRAEAYKRAGA